MEGKIKTEETVGIWFDGRYLPMSDAMSGIDLSGQPHPTIKHCEIGDRQESDPSNVTKFESFDDSQPIKEEQVENFYLNSQHFPSSVGTSQHEFLPDDSVTTSFDRTIKTECDEKSFTDKEENEHHKVNTTNENGVELQEKDINISLVHQLQQNDKQITFDSITNIHIDRNGLDRHIYICNPQGNPVKINVLFEQELESGNKYEIEALEGICLDQMGEKIKVKSEEEHEFQQSEQERMETSEKNESSLRRGRRRKRKNKALASLSKIERLDMLKSKYSKIRKKGSKNKRDTEEKDNPRLCSLCSCVLRNKTAYEYHLKSAHSSEKTYKCSSCGKLFEHKLLLNEHTKCHLNLKSKKGNYSCPYCDKVFQSRPGYNYHLKNHIPVKDHICSYCNKGFNTAHQLKSHKVRHTGEKPFKCQYCDKSFRYIVSMRYHRTECKMTRGNKTIKREKLSVMDEQDTAVSTLEGNAEMNTVDSLICRLCGKNYTSLTGLNYHLKRHSQEESKFFCTECGKVYKSLTGLKYHYRRCSTSNSNVCQTSNKQHESMTDSQSFEHDGNVSKPFQKVESVKKEIDSYVCNTCGKHYSSLTGFNYHLQKHNSKEQKHHCPVCGKEYTSKMGLRYHIKIVQCGVRKSFSCHICQKDYKSEIILKKHLEVHKCDHEDKKKKSYVCNICEKILKTRTGLKCHLETHSTTKEYKCTFCSKEYKAHRHLKLHMIQHTRQKQFLCSTCGKCFHTKFSLSIHERFHSGVRPNICHICGKQFVLKSCLNNHMTIHSGEKPHQCTVCSRKFRLKRMLRRHMLLHKPFWKYPCKLCGRGYTQKKNLDKHMMRHIFQDNTSHKTLQFSCSTCQKTFYAKRTFEKHLRLHSKDNPHKCDYCSEVFQGTKTLLQHLEKLHPENVPKNINPLKRLKQYDIEEWESVEDYMNVDRSRGKLNCKFCNVSFSNKGDLKKHVRRHIKISSSDDVKM